MTIPKVPPARPENPLVLTLGEAAATLAISTRMLQKQVRTGAIRPTYIGRRLLFTPDELTRFVERSTESDGARAR
ncbi:MAG TPA: helix-turn-helix domain-containing protein [Candidatus Binataceae bacterium]|nr:helix-turn-helix domain-containing protein [Candidatus Binataceae bacterium]HVA80268.1 helix-turn-helix domain-containing protein [Candidatus Binataceae bacterium]